ncbi:hypothetical protein CP97_13150 [Aurantiacibacter atlanticus]|uniref:Uncharacterized protein n=1 Tax=Aurantiacibacter atlanticus TaxID=1648404 RepID=A0A0H4VDM4_9SPHN|nr:hypothetical protein [Aurantiacibacter atlanticus]AKQ42782.1 hypothetical protein CP97_13150 [Aurantiacibacter atlanticus]MDF1836025.1 hypothetical protein [Alteraurantiacibacter sp. bin_em_oilr2.035]
MPNSRLTAKDIPSWTDKFAALGIPRGRITLLIGLDLVAELEKPEYAGARHRHLGIPPNLRTFELLGTSDIFHRPLGSFEPNAEEYTSGNVRAPAALLEVEAALAAEGVALVRGFGAAGKTTLARLMALKNDRAPKSVWYVDLSSQPAGSGSDILNELVEIVAPGVLVIIDNIHLDEVIAARLERLWRSIGKTLGTQLLLLGRTISSAAESPLAPLPAIELRAGYEEMRAVVNRLARRGMHSPPTVSDQVAAKWAKIFGNTARPSEVAVDLIAFTAAVEQRLPELLRGDMRLNPSDAVKGVRARYLEPLAGDEELTNLARLAALSEFEIEATDDLLPVPLAGLRRSTDEFGIILHGRTGAGRHTYRLIHAALGEILVSAGPSLDRSAELCAITERSPAAGLRILAGLRRMDASAARIQPVEAALAEAFAGRYLAASASTFDELRVLSRYAITNQRKTQAELDAEIARSLRLGELLASARTLPALNNFASWAMKLGLRETLAVIGAHALDPASALNETLYHSTIIDVCNLARALEPGIGLLEAIDHARWAKHQAQASPLPIGEVVAAISYLANSGHGALAVAPAHRQLMLAGERPLHECDISHLSQLVRQSHCEDRESAAIFAHFAHSGWLDRVYRDNAVGQVTGALLPLANHAGEETRAHLLQCSIDERVRRELSTSRPPNQAAKYAARGICLLGGYYALGGRIDSRTRVVHSTEDVVWMLSGLQIKRPLALGMYQIQFWLGLMALHKIGTGPYWMPLEAGEEFLRKFAASTAPTESAARIQKVLCAWLVERKKDGWLKEMG